MRYMNPVAKERAKCGYSQREMAKLMKLSYQTYMRFEHEPEKASVERMTKFKEITGCNITQTFFASNSTESSGID